MNAPTRWRTAVAGATGVLLLLGAGGCSADALRPSADDRYRLSAVFDDALNLPAGAPVKVNGLEVGDVVEIRPDDYRARVVMALEEGTSIPEGSTFRLRYTTALGELYVDVTPAPDGEPLADGDTVAAADSVTAPTVEDSLASASLLVNGGNLGQVQTIVHELNTALSGRVGEARGLLTETDRFLAETLRSTRQIDRVLNALADSATILDERQETIDRALRDLRPAAEVLTDNTDELAGLLRSTDRMAVTADRLVRRTRDDLLVIVRELGPVLDEVLAAEDELVPGLDTLHTFAERMDHAVPTDYLNLKFRLHLDAAIGSAPDLPPRGDDPDNPLPGLPGLPPLPELPDLPVPDLPDPTLPPLPFPGLPGLSGVVKLPDGLAGPQEVRP